MPHRWGASLGVSMRVKALLSVALGLVLAVTLVVAAKMLMSDEGAQALEFDTSDRYVSVYVANRTIQFGERVSEDAVALQPWPAAHVPQGAFTEADMLFPPTQGPRRARNQFFEGEVILAPKLSLHGEAVAGIAIETAGNQAKALTVSSAAVASGYVMPGDLVDVVLIEEVRGDLRAVTIERRLRVLAVENGVSPRRSTIDRTVVVEVTAGQAHRLALAQTAGSLSLTVRTDPDAADRGPVVISLSEVLPDSAQAVGEASEAGQTALSYPEPPEEGVIVRRGGVATFERIENARP